MEDMKSLVRRSESKTQAYMRNIMKRMLKEIGCNGVDHFWTQTTGGLLCAGNYNLGFIKGEEF
jgi:hypothetical protein